MRGELRRPIEAWMEVISQFLYLVPFDMRIELLEKALERERSLAHESSKLNFIDLGEYADKPIPPQPTDIQAALAYTFTRAVTNTNARGTAAKLLFHTHHSAAPGWMLDYLKRLPGIKVVERAQS